jgi:hypothetical protein
LMSAPWRTASRSSSGSLPLPLKMVLRACSRSRMQNRLRMQHPPAGTVWEPGLEHGMHATPGTEQAALAHSAPRQLGIFGSPASGTACIAAPGAEQAALAHAAPR